MVFPSPRISSLRHQNRGRERPVTCLLLLVVALMAGVTACTTERSVRKNFLKRVTPPQPLLMASAVYGVEKLAVQAWLGPSVRLRKADEQAGAPGDRRRTRESQPTHEPGYFDRFSAPFEEQGRNPDEFSQAEIDEMYGRVNYAYILPPRLALTLTFANTGSSPLMFTITEVNSILGNFAPRPESLTLAPGQQRSLDPMLSNLDNNFEELDLTLSVRQGGNRETQVLRLRRAPTPAPANPSK
jgi:hypothetical protein